MRNAQSASNPRRPRHWPPWAVFGFVALCVLLAQNMLIFNPGYFSHDELQWAVIAHRHPGCAFCNGMWADLRAFQYRPLTFSIWIWLSQRFFEHPYAFHAVLVAGGAVNAAMFALLLRRTGIGVAGAVLGSLVFALGPYAAFTVGWVGTLADLIWVACGLGIGLLMQRDAHSWLSYGAVFLLTSTALLAKEAAVVIPALLALAWWFSGRRRHWGAATLMAAIPVLIYLAIRLKIILHGPGAGADIYAWSLAAMPVRWAEFQLFPAVTNLFGSDGMLAHGLRGNHLQKALLLWLALAWALWRAGPRYLAAFLLAGTAALGPVLILQVAATWYGYGFAAVTTAVCVMAWLDMPRSGRVVLLLVAAVSVWHGMYIMRMTHAIGEKQARFSPALAAAISAGDGKTVSLSVQNERERWIYERFTFQIPSYRGVPIGDRVRLVAPGAPADYEIMDDGDLDRLAVR